ncbi:MAG: radical SAM protein, partial [Planctomycetota bacterium]
EKLVSGLCAFRKEFAGQIWLEVFLAEDLNTNAEQITKLDELIKRIRPDKVQLNTAVRPTAEAGVKKFDDEKLQTIADQLGEGCEVVTDSLPSRHGRHIDGRETTPEDVLSMLKRRPCSLNDICSALGLHHNEALKYVGRTFFKAN